MTIDTTPCANCGTPTISHTALCISCRPAASLKIAEYKPGQWFDAETVDEMQAFYLSRLPAIREAAQAHGYAIGLHGSERRDFDLMAMQWRADVSDKDTLAHAIADAACGIRREGAYDWETKPCGRVAVSIPICWTAHDNPDLDKPSVGHIDLSVIDRASGSQAAPDAKAEEIPPSPTEAVMETISTFLQNNVDNLLAARADSLATGIVRCIYAAGSILAAPAATAELTDEQWQVIERAIRFIDTGSHTHIARDTMTGELRAILAAQAAQKGAQ